jgi:hypothetical protein
MKALIPSAFRAVVVLTSLFAVSAHASAKNPAPADPAAEQLARAGSVSLKNAGAYVEIGTFAIQVSTKLGRPSVVLPEGTWLYENRQIDGSNATGTLVVRFKEGRVSDLSLVTPAVALAMREPKRVQERTLVAKKQ